jgi:hypothetical protein
MNERQPFDPSDPTDAMSEMFRLQVTDIALAAYKITTYRELNTQEQLECFLAGAMTGVIGVALASISTAGADAMMKAIVDIIPQCREMAENIMAPNGNPVINRHDLAKYLDDAVSSCPQVIEVASK